MERKIKVKNPKLKALILDKEVSVKEGRKLFSDIEKMVAKQKKKGEEIQAKKNKMIPIVLGLKLDLAEFEDIISFDVEGDDVSVLVIDQVEAFKNRHREKKNAELLEDNTKNKRPVKAK